MHLLNLATTIAVLALLGVEISVAVFINPTVWRLHADHQESAISLFATVLISVGKPWYTICLLLLVAEAWFHRHTPVFSLLVFAAALWVVIIVGAMVWMMPIFYRLAAQSAGDWRAEHERWHRMHLVRIVIMLASAGALLHAGVL